MIGSHISHYEILGRIGEGGMGVVYKARDMKLERVVALKFLPPELANDPDARLQFLREARASSPLQHKNVCVIYDIDETDDDHPFISMEYLEGETLQQRLAAGPLQIRESVRIASQIAAGLARAHEIGVVHRDLTPANIMLTNDGQAKILDFGIAHARAGNPHSPPAEFLGTAAYASPEQTRGDLVDQRTDIWSLGVILYETLTGRSPFAHGYLQAVHYSVINEPHAPARSLRHDLPPDVERLIDRCLQKAPDQRFQDGAALLAALSEIRHAPRTEGAPTVKALAVLPFTDNSPEKDNQYFSDGLTEEIITKLSRVRNIRIISLGSVTQYERKGKGTRQIAEELNVQYILDGSVRKHGSALRITTQLIDATIDAYLWAETYSGTVEEVFDIQDDVAGRIVKALRVRLTPDDRRTLKRRATIDTGAYQLYLKGRHLWSKRSREGILAAIWLFEEAIARDPQYAPAWAGVADSYLLYENAGMAREEAYAKAKSAVQKALAIDARLAEAHASLGLLAMLSEWDWNTAEREFKKAIEESPSYATAHHWYGEWLTMQGRSAEAYAEISHAIELDPRSPGVLKDRGWASYYARQYTPALEDARGALKLDPDFLGAHRLLSMTYLALGSVKEALAEHTLWTGGTERGLEEKAWLAYILAAGGRSAEAREMLKEFPARGSADARLVRAVGLVYVALGENDKALTWLERAIEARTESLGTIGVDPKVDPLRPDPRFADLLRRVGLSSPTIAHPDSPQ